MPRKGNAEVSVESDATQAAVQIISECLYGRTIAESYGIDTFISETIAALQDNSDSNYYFSCFSPEDFFRVFTEAIRRVDYYDATPGTLHLYIGGDNPFIDELELPSGEALTEIQIRFLFLRVLRWFSEFPMYQAHKTGIGSYEPAWADNFADCDGSQDDPNSILGSGSERNLRLLIHPVLPMDDFDYFRREVQLLPNDTRRLEYAIETLANYRQTVGEEPKTITNEYGGKLNGYAENLRIEIEKLESLIALDKAASAAKEIPDEGPHIPGKFSIKEAMVLLDYLATTPDVWAKSTHGAKAEFVLRLSAHDKPSVKKIEFMFSRANFDEIKRNKIAFLNNWKERFLPSTQGRKQS